MEHVQLAVWAEDLALLGWDFLQLIRDVVAKDPEYAQSLFNFRRQKTGLVIHRLTRTQLNRVIEHGGLPLTLKEMSPRELEELMTKEDGGAFVDQGSNPEIARYLDLQYQYLLMARELARSCAATAAGVTKSRNADTMRLLARANLQKLRNLKHQAVVRFEPSVAFEMAIYLAEQGVSAERLALTGLCASSWGAVKNQALGMGMLA